MVYEQTNWKSGDTITSAGLNKIESGISNVETKSDTNDLSHEERLAALELSLKNLIVRIDSLPKPTAEVVSPSSAANQTVTSTGDVYISDTLSGVATVSAKSINIDDSSVSNGRLALTANETVSINNLSTSGTLAKSVSNAAISVNNSDNVYISNSTFDQTSYNGIEIGLASSSLPGDVVIENCVFTKNSNNSITVFDTQDDAVITVKNCTFVDSSNPLRISNRSNVRVTVNLIDCDFQKVDSDPSYSYVILCQDYTSADAAACAANNLFAPEKIKINFTNCQLEGNPMVAERAVYVYRDKGGGLVSDPAAIPAVTVK